MGVLVVSCALSILPTPRAEAGIISHAVSGAVGGAVVHKGADMLAKRKAAKAQKAAADKAAGREPAPSAMGKEFDDTLKERMGKIKNENKAAREASGQAQAPSFKTTLGERLKHARDAQRADVAASRKMAP